MGSFIGIFIFLLPFIISWLRRRYVKKQTSKESFTNCIKGGMMGWVYAGVFIFAMVEIIHVVLLI